MDAASVAVNGEVVFYRPTEVCFSTSNETNIWTVGQYLRYRGGMLGSSAAPCAL